MTVTTTPRPTGHPGYSTRLPREAESAAIARHLVRTALAAWDLEELIEDAVLVMSELVSNAVDHGCLPHIRVIVNRPTKSWVCLGVVDRSKVVPMMRTDSNSDGDPIRGRGLVIVDALTDRWGTDLYGWGKQVWGELRAGAGEPPDAAGSPSCP
ncbi:ATP-binding protein [Streptomyces sp. SGAir0957]